MGGGQLGDGRTWRFNFIFPFLYLFFCKEEPLLAKYIVQTCI